MPVAWFFAPYKRRDPRPGVPGRYCAMDDFTTRVTSWSECECLGDQAIVKVNATNNVLNTIANTAGFQRIPLQLLDDPLSSLTANQRTAIKNKLIALGYTLAEVQAALGSDLSTVTLRQVLRFALTRRLQPRYDQPTDTIILDGSAQPCRPVEDADADVQ